MNSMKDARMSDRVALGAALIVLQALLTALDAMIIDMYLPIGQGFGVVPRRVQQTLTISFSPAWLWVKASIARCLTAMDAERLC
jgi:hypothetical protein